MMGDTISTLMPDFSLPGPNSKFYSLSLWNCSKIKIETKIAHMYGVSKLTCLSSLVCSYIQHCSKCCPFAAKLTFSVY